VQGSNVPPLRNHRAFIWWSRFASFIFGRRASKGKGGKRGEPETLGFRRRWSANNREGSELLTGAALFFIGPGRARFFDMPATRAGG